VHTGRIPPVEAVPERFVEHLVATGTDESWSVIASTVMTRHPLADAGYTIDQLVLPVPTFLRPLTSTITQAGLSPKESGVRSITTTGGYVTGAMRRIVRDEWDARFFNAYGMGEVGLAAIECSERKLHFLFTLIPEVVDPVTLETCEDGQTGLLLVTTLYPFQQAMPLIRYSTGDLISMSSKRCACGSEWPHIQRFVGRLDFSQRVDSGENRHQWISPITTKEVLEQFPALFSYDHFGRLMFRQDLVTDRPRPRLVVKAELSAPANLLPEGSLSRAKNEVVEALLAAHQEDFAGAPLPFEIELRLEPHAIEQRTPFFLRL